MRWPARAAGCDARIDKPARERLDERRRWASRSRARFLSVLSRALGVGFNRCGRDDGHPEATLRAVGARSEELHLAVRIAPARLDEVEVGVVAGATPTGCTSRQGRARCIRGQSRQPGRGPASSCPRLEPHHQQRAAAARCVPRHGGARLPRVPSRIGRQRRLGGADHGRMLSILVGSRLGGAARARERLGLAASPGPPSRRPPRPGAPWWSRGRRSQAGPRRSGPRRRSPRPGQSPRWCCAGAGSAWAWPRRSGPPSRRPPRPGQPGHPAGETRGRWSDAAPARRAAAPGPPVGPRSRDRLRGSARSAPWRGRRPVRCRPGGYPCRHVQCSSEH
jgi:hypothetical protein